MKTEIKTDRAPAAIGAYSQAVVAGKTLYVSGQLPMDPSTGKLGEGIKEQTRLAMTNIKNIVEESGGDINSIVKCGIFIKNMNDFSDINDAYKSFFSDGVFPARFVVEVSQLPKGAIVEIDAIAVLQ